MLDKIYPICNTLHDAINVLGKDTKDIFNTSVKLIYSSFKKYPSEINDKEISEFLRRIELFTIRVFALSIALVCAYQITCNLLPFVSKRPFSTMIKAVTLSFIVCIMQKIFNETLKDTFPSCLSYLNQKV